MKLFYIKLFFMFLLILCFRSFGQTKTEIELYKIQHRLDKQTKELDSLNFLLNKKVNLINEEKSKTNPNKEKIENLLSGTSNLTNSIEQKELEISLSNKKLGENKKALYAIYSHQIDSLKSIGKEKYSDEIMDLTEKRLSVSSKIDLLSFDPSKVLKLSPTNDQAKQKVYNEFLTSAKDEVERRISEIQNLKDEVSNIIALNSAKEEFLEEISFNNRIVGSRKINNQTTSASTEYGRDPDVSNANNAVKEYSNSFNGILNQLSINNLSNPLSASTRKLSSDYYTNTNLKDFIDLMNKVEKELSDYKIVINNKLKEN
jgi:hypothetical protein